ncbi:unnamed protein product [Cylindrotheca closterium]|uniref:Histone chaperone domain-containing protein n=1 Tax=Cylindrotheca closterium TaxID=2856 RepID=A0AAD2CEV3_9STRA|nr:unnamed protein product [Cylindrotheca closterium]
MPSSSSATIITASRLEKEIKAIFDSPSFEFENESEKSIRKQVMERLGMDGKFPSDKKELFKKVIAQVVQERADDDDDGDDGADDDNGEDSDEESHKSDIESNDDDDDGDDGVDDDAGSDLLDSDEDDQNVDPAPKARKKLSKKKESPIKKKKVVKKTKETSKASKSTTNKTKKSTKKSSSPTTTSAASTPAYASYGTKVQSLLKLGQAMRFGPRLHAGLKDMQDDDERIEALTKRLQDAGATWKGIVPSTQDIQAAKAEKKRKDDLDGLDTSLIIQEGRGRRNRGSVNYALPSALEDDEDADEKIEEEEEEVKRPTKKRKSPKKKQDDDDDDDDDDGDFQGDSSDGEDDFGSDAELEDYS